MSENASRRQKQVADRLRDMIIRGEIATGAHMQEIPLSEQMGVSRTPVREALVVLANEGLLIYRQNRGYVVREFLLRDVLDAYRVREYLEGLACRQLAETGIDDATAADISECLELGDKIFSIGYLTDEGIEPWRKVNSRFHTAIVQATGNRSLIQALERTVAIPMASSNVVHWFDRSDAKGFQRLMHVHEQHHSIFDAICRRQVYRAELKMREHIKVAADHIEASYANPGAEAAAAE